MKNTVKIASEAARLYLEPLLWVKKAFNNLTSKFSRKEKTTAKGRSALYKEIDNLIKNQNEVIFSFKSYHEELEKDFFEDLHQELYDLEREKDLEKYIKHLKNAIDSINAIEVKFEDAEYKILLEKETLEKKYVERIKKASEPRLFFEILIVESILKDLKEFSSSTFEELKSSSKQTI